MPESTGYAVKNNAESTVADNPLTSSATTLNVAAGQGSRFPSTFPFLVTIWDDVTHPDPTDDPNMEIAECTARSSDALTIARGKEETSGVEHANGARVAMLITAGIFDDPTYGILTKLNGIEDNATADQTKVDIDALGINADQVDGCDAGNGNDQVHKIASSDTTYSMYIKVSTGVGTLFPGDEGKVLTTHSSSNPPSWETPSESGDMLKSIYDTNNDGTVDDADKVDGHNAGNGNDQVHVIASGDTTHSIYVKVSSGIGALMPGTDGYQLTTHSSSGVPSWEPPYSHPSAPPCRAATSEQTGHATSTQISKLDGIAEGANNYTHPSTIQCNANNYSHPSSRQCTSGAWAAASIDGTLPVSHGGTGVTGDSYDARYVNGCDTGNGNNQVYKIDSGDTTYSVYVKVSTGIGTLMPGTDGYQLTTHSSNSAPSWSASSDLIFSDTHCPKCGKKFEDGDNLILRVVGHNECGDTLTIPMHKECAEASKKTVTIKRKVMEDRFIFDEFTGEPRVQRVRKMQKKNVTKKRMKKDVELDYKTGEFWQIEDEKRKKKITVTDATEEYEEEIDEQIYKNVEFEI